MQLTILGGYRAMRNPELAKSEYYRKALISILVSMVVQLLIWAPVMGARWILHIVDFFSRGNNREIEQWIKTLKFWQSVLNVGPILISAVRYIRPEMDELFLKSLQFVDSIYKQKHPESDRMYYNALIKYDKERAHRSTKPKGGTVSAQDKLSQFIKRSGIRVGQTIAIYMLSGVPILGSLVLPITWFQSLNRVAGTPAAATLCAISLFAPKRWTMTFLAAFWGGRSLARELLMPYFNRIPFSRAERERWFSAREGIMFGFGAGFYLLLKIPFIGVLVYGFAEASAAYLITKVSDPPPPPALLYTWTESQTLWTHGDEALMSSLDEDNDKPAPPPLPPREDQQFGHTLTKQITH